MSGSHPTNEPNTSSQYKAVHDFASGPTVSLSYAQDAFVKPVEDTFFETQNAEEVESALWRSWGSFLKVVGAVGQDSSKCQKLADFVLALSQRPDLKRDGEVCRVWDLAVWSDLPIFGASMRDRWNTPAESSSEDERRAWLNLTAFTATLVSSAHNSNADKPDFTLYAVWALREAFEEPNPSDIAIEAAATWLTVASSALTDLSKSGKSFDGKLAKSGSACSDKDWKGYSDERLQTWLSRLRAVDTASLDAQGKDSVIRAKEEVQAIAV